MANRTARLRRLDRLRPPVFPGADRKIGERLTGSFGAGIGTTDGSREVVLKSRLEYEFGRKHD